MNKLRLIPYFLFVSCLLFFVPFSGEVQASGSLPVCQPKCGPTRCIKSDCDDAKDVLDDHHEDGEDQIIDFVGKSHGRNGRGGTGQFGKFEDWLLDPDSKTGFIIDNVFRAMQMMTEQLSAIAMQQVMIVGTFFDAKHQMETYRLFQELQTGIHRDYHPSEDFCWFGTNTRSLAHSERNSDLTAHALNARQKARHLGSAPNPSMGVAGAYNRSHDRQARWVQFADHYCDPQDNGYVRNGTGLDGVCNGGDRINNDIDFTRIVEMSRTLDLDFSNGARGLPPPNEDEWESSGNDLRYTEDEEDILALSSNLYGHDVLTRASDETYLKNKENQHLYLALRSVAAKRSVAEHSFNSIVGLKANGSTDVGAAGEQTRNFLYAVMEELGMSAEDIEKVMGENPSYYAQLEILAKRIYQNPNFYADLYDKPANVARKSTALYAIELMLDRAIYESQIRREMMTSVLLSAALREPYQSSNNAMGN